MRSVPKFGVFVAIRISPFSQSVNQTLTQANNLLFKCLRLRLVCIRKFTLLKCFPQYIERQYWRKATLHGPWDPLENP